LVLFVGTENMQQRSCVNQQDEGTTQTAFEKSTVFDEFEEIRNLESIRRMESYI
jgi:hypothetical protein